MAELKNVRKPERAFVARDRWLLDVEEGETVEQELNPYAGRLFGDEPDSDNDEGLDSVGRYHSLFDF